MVENNVHTSLESVEALQGLAEDIEREIAEITSSIRPLQQRLDAAHEKLDLVRRLIHLSAPNAGAPPGDADAGSVRPDIEDHLEDILRSNGKPMHIRDIRASLIQMGIPLPGRGDEANIILRLRRASDRFVRTARGTYALVAWNLPEYSPAPSKKRVPKRKGLAL